MRGGKVMPIIVCFGTVLLLAMPAAADLPALSADSNFFACYMAAKRAETAKVKRSRNGKRLLRPKRIRASISASCSGSSPGGTSPSNPNPTTTPIVTPTPIPADTIGGPVSNHFLIRARQGFDPLNPPPAACLSQKMTAWGAARIRNLHRNLGSSEAAQAFGLNRSYIVEFNQNRGNLIYNIVNDFNSCITELELASTSILIQLDLPSVPGGSSIASVPSCANTSGGSPSDTAFNCQWGLHNVGQPVEGLPSPSQPPYIDVNFPEALAIHPNIECDATTVAVIDSGVDPHPEFSSRLLPGKNTFSGATSSDSGDDLGHGTAMAGIIAAGGNNGTGIAGIAWGAKILPIRVTAPGNSTNTTALSIADGITAAVTGGATVLNISAGATYSYYNNGYPNCNANTEFSQCSSSTNDICDCHAEIQELKRALDYAAASDVLCVAAVGNDGTAIAYPARFSNCLAVGAMTNNGGAWVGENRGPQMDLIAPGIGIYTTWVNSNNNYDVAPYGFIEAGTSSSAAFVTGVAALVRSKNRYLSSEAVYDIIKGSVDPVLFWGAPLYPELYGAGRLNAFRALQNTPATCRTGHIDNGCGTCTAVLTPVGDGDVFFNGATWQKDTQSTMLSMGRRADLNWNLHRSYIEWDMSSLRSGLSSYPFFHDVGLIYSGGYQVDSGVFSLYGITPSVESAETIFSALDNASEYATSGEFPNINGGGPAEEDLGPLAVSELQETLEKFENERFAIGMKSHFEEYGSGSWIWSNESSAGYQHPLLNILYTPQQQCGNGLIESTLTIREYCDDGNSGSGDGCNNQCIIEPSWECRGEPSECWIP